MITSVFKTYVGKKESEKTFWTYLICRVRSGHRNRFNVIRIDNTVEKMQVLGRELTLAHCKRIIKNFENYSTKKL